MQIKTYPLGEIGTNCYFVGDETTGKGCIIDPGDEAPRLLQLWEAFGFGLSAVLVTHGHYDHTTALPAVAQEYPNVPIYIHQVDVCEGGRPAFYQCDHQPKMQYIKDGDVIAVGNLRFTVLETPGHTPGGIVFKGEGSLFTGDTLFAGSCGRVDFPGGDWGQMCASLRRLAALEGDYKVYPGHEYTTTLQRERQSNPYIRSALQLGEQ
jgi:glyoxylase-like metal-dependent hydrolase (beta-lactamase superfamily II)